MPANEKYTLGITTEFSPIWDLFKKSTNNMDKADLIRKLIFQHLASKSIHDYTWKKIRNALKTHKKFIDGNLELEEMYKGFYVTNFNDYYETADDESIKEYLDEYEYSTKRFLPSYDYNLIRKNANSTNFGSTHNRLSFYKARPGIKLVIEKKKSDSYRILEGLYSYLKKSKSKTVADLLGANQDIYHYEEEGIFDHPRILVKIDGEEYDLQNLNIDAVRKHPEFGKISWKDIPKEIDDALVLKRYHLKNKKNFSELRKNQKITFMHSVYLEFDSQGQMLGLPENRGFDKVIDGKINENQIIEVED